ncbi:MAG: hypothetical protein HWE19_15740, partial [Vibrionaceae bacterium]|nr:hypothetical protein [Vibrionaceae bacterium]
MDESEQLTKQWLKTLEAVTPLAKVNKPNGDEFIQLEEAIIQAKTTLPNPVVTACIRSALSIYHQNASLNLQL